MKHVFSLLLFFIIFSNVLTSRRSLKMRMAKVEQAMKLISDSSKKKLRNLEQTDVPEDSEAPYVSPTSTVYSSTTSPDQPESGISTAEDATVNADKPVSSKGQVTNKKEAKVKVTKFHGIKAPREPGRISFGSFFYFIGRPIPFSVIFRLRITYNSRLRNLQTTAQADSARSNYINTNPELAG
jgi:hypothetical protein